MFFFSKGEKGIDTDIPTKYEGQVFRTKLLKVIWVMLQVFFYVLRPLSTKPKQPGFWEIVNWTYVILVDVLILYFFGVKALLYLLISALMGLFV